MLRAVEFEVLERDDNGNMVDLGVGKRRRAMVAGDKILFVAQENELPPKIEGADGTPVTVLAFEGGATLLVPKPMNVVVKALRGGR